MYRYETHLHTAPVSKCAGGTVGETLRYYKALGYDGVFITNHFLDGNVNIAAERPLEERLAFYFSDYEAALDLGAEIGIRVFLGVELSYKGTDFLIYGLNPAWYFAHPEILEMDKRTELAYLREAGALVIHAHPYREAKYIDHIRLYPRSVDGVEVVNACRTELENRMAALYAENYGLCVTAGSDNHRADGQKKLAGMESETALIDEADFIARVRAGTMRIFTVEAE